MRNLTDEELRQQFYKSRPFQEFFEWAAMLDPEDRHRLYEMINKAHGQPPRPTIWLRLELTLRAFWLMLKLRWAQWVA